MNILFWYGQEINIFYTRQSNSISAAILDSYQFSTGTRGRFLQELLWRITEECTTIPLGT